MVPLNEALRADTLRDTEGRMGVSGAREGRNEAELFDGGRVSVLQDEEVQTPVLNSSLRNGSDGTFYVVLFITILKQVLEC